MLADQLYIVLADLSSCATVHLLSAKYDEPVMRVEASMYTQQYLSSYTGSCFVRVVSINDFLNSCFCVMVGHCRLLQALGTSRLDSQPQGWYLSPPIFAV